MKKVHRWSWIEFLVSAFCLLSFFHSANSVHAQTLFTKDLRLGAQSSEVTALQQFLNHNLFLVAATGSGSVGHETRYFGPATAAAVIQFQKANHISPATGFFGPLTRQKINNELSTATVITTTSRGVEPSVSSTATGYTVGGTIVGVVGSVTLANNGDTLTINSGDSSNFVFPNKIASGASYTITVVPSNPDVLCYTKDTVGIVVNAPVTNSKIACGIGLRQNPFLPIAVGRPQYTLTYAAGSGGSLAGAARQTIVSGSSGSAVTAVPDSGYHFVAWSDGLTANPRVDATPTRDQAITATFARTTYTITPSVVGAGLISPNSVSIVNEGDTLTFTLTPDAGHSIADVLVDGSSVGAVTTYDFTAITSDHTIVAEFATDTPSLLFVSPNSGIAGDIVTITGQHLSDIANVSFGGTSASFTVINDNTIVATVPIHSGGILDVEVDGPNGSAILPGAFVNFELS